MTVGELGRRMSSHELTEWMAFYELEPFGDEWRQTASITSLMANVNRDTKKRTQPYEIEDFMPIDRTTTEEAETPDSADLLAKFDRIVGGFSA